MPRDAASLFFPLAGSEANLQTSDGCVAPQRHNNEEQVTLKGCRSQEEVWHQAAIKLLRRPPLYFQMSSVSCSASENKAGQLFTFCFSFFYETLQVIDSKTIYKKTYQFYYTQDRPHCYSGGVNKRLEWT